MSDSSLSIGTQCDCCQFYAFSEYLVCTLHPAGPVEKTHCHDFDPWPHDEIFWAPVGTEFYPGTLQDETQPNPYLSRQTLREKLERIEAHPIFSGHCPQCGHKLGYEPKYLWNCDRCGWKDNLEV